MVSLVAAAFFVQGASAWKAKGEALLQQEKYQEASEAFLKSSEAFEKNGDPNAAQILRERSLRYRTVIELFEQTSVPKEPLAKFEPASGMYLGANIEREEGARSPAAFNKATGKNHAIYFTYKKYGNPFPAAFARDLKANGAALQIAWEPDSLASVQDDKYLADFADAIRKSGIPVFVRFASEMNGNWVPYHGDPLQYRVKFRLVANRIHEIAPNAAMVWSPNAIPEKPIDDYYPGAEYVDWVGVNFYSVMYNDADRSRAAEWRFPTDSVEYVYRKYSNRHPVMVAEWAASHRSSIESEDRPEFARQKIREFFRTVPTKYPRLKAASWLSFNALKYAKTDRQLNNYSLLNSPTVLETYREEASSPHFLSQVGMSQDVRWSYTNVASKRGDKMRLFVRTYDSGFVTQVSFDKGQSRKFTTELLEFKIPSAAQYVEVSVLGSRNKVALKKRFPVKNCPYNTKAMWQRFTENARRVVFYAQEEAQNLGATSVCTEQLLLGILRQADTTAGIVLTELGLSFEVCRSNVIEKIHKGSTPTSADMTLSPRAKRIIDLAFDEARSLGNDYIGTEHLLIALIREQDGIAAKTLFEHRIELEATRSKVQEVQLRQDRPTKKPHDYSKAQQRLREELLWGKVRAISELVDQASSESLSYALELERLKAETDNALNSMQRSLLLGLCMEVEQGGAVLDSDNWKKLGLTKDQAQSLSKIGVQVHRLLEDETI